MHFSDQSSNIGIAYRKRPPLLCSLVLIAAFVLSLGSCTTESQSRSLKSSLEEPDREPVCGSVRRQLTNPPIATFLQKYHDIHLLHYQNDSFALVSARGHLLQINLSTSQVTQEIKLLNQKMFGDASSVESRPYGLTKSPAPDGSENYFVCATTNFSYLEPPFYKLENSTLVNDQSTAGWPPNYCTNGRESDFVVVYGSSTYSRLKPLIATAEIQKGIRVRLLRKNQQNKLLHLKDRQVLKLIGGFHRANVPYFVWRELLVGRPASDSSSYINRISKICELNETQSEFLLSSLQIFTHQLRCSFDQHFEFGRLVWIKYEPVSKLLYGLYNTWDNSPKGSALCVHSLYDLELGECDNEQKMHGRRDYYKSSKDPVFVITRQDYWLQSFTMESVANSNEMVLFYFATSRGSVLKYLINVTSFATTFLTLYEFPFATSLTQLEIVGQKLFISTNYGVLLEEKHSCHAYPCHLCRKDPFCKWGNGVSECIKNESPNWLLSLNESHSQEECEKQPVEEILVTKELRATENAAGEGEKLLLSEPKSFLDYHSIATINSDQTGMLFEFTFMKKEIKVDMEMLRDTTIILIPSLICGIICGMFLTYGIAGVIVTRRRKLEKTLEENYVISNYKTGSNPSVNDMSSHTRRAVSVSEVLRTEAQEKFLPRGLSPRLSNRVNCSNAVPVESTAGRENSPQYTCIPNDEAFSDEEASNCVQMYTQSLIRAQQEDPRKKKVSFVRYDNRSTSTPTKTPSVTSSVKLPPPSPMLMPMGSPSGGCRRQLVVEPGVARMSQREHMDSDRSSASQQPPMYTFSGIPSRSVATRKPSQSSWSESSDNVFTRNI